MSFSLPSMLLFAGVYALALAILAISNRAEFKRCPHKGARYKALPLFYKCACWFGVVPVAIGGIVHGGLFFLAVILFMLLEVACVRWYKKAGHL
ncbi:MAG TPA: hypothetical protein VFS95_11400 [Telluria sp.]|nr:hypothetical protein [Telluria sp.]